MAVSNGSFETGTFAEWQTIGDTSIETDEFGVIPTDGQFQALITNGFSDSGGSVSDIDLVEFLDLPDLDFLESISDGDVIEGSAIKQTLFLEVGDVLRVDFNFLTDETTYDEDPTTYNDFAFYTIVPEITTPDATKLADTSETISPSPTRFDTETGYLEIEISESGTFTLGLGVVDVDASDFDSGLLVDNIQVISSGNSRPDNPDPNEQVLRIEAEDMDLVNYEVEDNSIASGGQLISLAGALEDTGTASTTFDGLSGVYEVVVGYFDENDGIAQLQLQVNDDVVGSLILDEDLGSAEADEMTFTEGTISEVELNPGDILTLQGTRDSGEFARVDYIDLIPSIDSDGGIVLG